MGVSTFRSQGLWANINTISRQGAIKLVGGKARGEGGGRVGGELGDPSLGAGINPTRHCSTITSLLMEMLVQWNLRKQTLPRKDTAPRADSCAAPI